MLGLLAFPTVLKGMNEHLDWVQAMGDAVTRRLPDVQDSIQQVRAEFYAGGVLKSDDKQTVEVDSEIIRVPSPGKGFFGAAAGLLSTAVDLAKFDASHLQLIATAPSAMTQCPDDSMTQSF